MKLSINLTLIFSPRLRTRIDLRRFICSPLTYSELSQCDIIILQFLLLDKWNEQLLRIFLCFVFLYFNVQTKRAYIFFIFNININNSKRLINISNLKETNTVYVEERD